jgi:hypothetical protein
VIEAGKEITKIFSKVINKTLKLINKEWLNWHCMKDS